MEEKSATSNFRNYRKIPPVKPEDKVVISGIAGRFPESNNMKQFQENLFNKVDLLTDDTRRWDIEHPEIPPRTGKINDIEKFDASFFGVHFKQATAMDPMCRMLLEHSYEAIVDAGYNPRQLRGSKTGVFIGTSFSESERTYFHEKLQVNGFGIMGCSRAMLANRISYWLGVHGPSYNVDTACSSSLYAFEQAYRAIRDGLCDAAIVGGCNLCLNPFLSLQFSRLGVLTMDGKCKSFDADANGYARSEAVGVVFLQRAKDAKRIYSTVMHAKTNCDGYKEQGITFPSSDIQSALLEEFYQECGIPPTSLNYIEAHGTGTTVGDPEEVNAIDKVCCTGRSTPLRLGSVKSNLGHSEPASGMCSIAKVIIAMETGMIPANLHFKRPREGIKGLEEGRLKVVTDLTPWEGGLAGINAFGFGGANAHLLLQSHAKEKINNGAPKDSLPRLVAVSGRTEESVKSFLNDIENRPVDVEYIGLFHNVYSESITGHMYRGYTIVGRQDQSGDPIREIQHYPDEARPIWFVFSGMGSQWPGMGEALLAFPIFAEAIKKCDAVLKPRGLDIYHIITTKDKKIFDNILHSFVGIAAVQIGLIDLMNQVGIVPDNIIGHSVGELACAYADGCFTAEQMILSAYSRGLASIETKIIRGSMAAIGMGYQGLKGMCPKDIAIACHNGPDSCTISGPAASVQTFVAQLMEKNIFAKEVPSSGIPYHSPYIATAGPKLLAYLKEVIPNPKPRSPKWLSTSVPQSGWSSPAAGFSSAEYHTTNLLSAVLFEETAALIPKNAITIEIAPHGLLQAILRRSLHKNVTNVALTQRGHKNNVEHVLQALGKLYNIGLHPKLANLYPDVAFPVSRGTPMISPLIKWEHSEDWFVTSYKTIDKKSGERIVKVTLGDEDYEYMEGHVIDGRNLLPATGYLVMVWETYAMTRGESYIEVPVVFEDVKFLRATTISKEGFVELTVMVQKGTGRFEIVEGGVAVVTGLIRPIANPAEEKYDSSQWLKSDEKQEMVSRDIYKELRLRGYHYSGLFRSLTSSNMQGTNGRISWHNNWVAFMDNMLQMKLLGFDTRALFVPTAIEKLVIDVKSHVQQIRRNIEEAKDFVVCVNNEVNAIVAGGVELRGLKANAISRRKRAGKPVLENYQFVAHRDKAEVSLSEAVHLMTHVALENHSSVKVKTIELITEKDKCDVESLLSPKIIATLEDIPLIQADVNVVAENFENTLPSNISIVDRKKINAETKAMLGVAHRLLTENQESELEGILEAIDDGGFVVTWESLATNNIDQAAKKHGMNVIMEKKVEGQLLVLLRKQEQQAQNVVVVKVNNNEFSWLEEMKKAMKAELDKDYIKSTRIIFVGERDFETGLLGLVNCLRKEPGGEVVRGILIQDTKSPTFSLKNAVYSNQVQLDLAVSVLRLGGIWGSYRHLPLPPPEPRPVHHACVRQLVRGDLSSFNWIEGHLQPDNKHPDLIRVAYSSMNFREVMMATGRLATEEFNVSRLDYKSIMGFEYCGIDNSGRRIMGMQMEGTLTNLLIADRTLSWEIPHGWSLEDAATVPVVYSTCYVALYSSGNMKKGDKVLIHAGSGGVGQAAITLALHEGCEVFTTVGTPEKREFIKKRFPQVRDDHIGNSRDCSFQQLILTQTNGRGVDIVLNSLAEEKLQASVRCLAPGGRFLEIGKFDLAADNPLGMSPFLKEISFHGIMLDALFIGSQDRKEHLQSIIAEGLRSGAIKPLPRSIFSCDQLEDAFRFMAAGKHIGKVIIRVQDSAKLENAAILALPRYHCSMCRSYVILGGLGGFGLELADWLVLRGARNLVLTSRTGLRNGYQKTRVELWKSYGVNVKIVAGKDASKEQDCKDIIKAAIDLAPVDGIFNLAVILKDGIWENQTDETFQESFRSKAWSTKQLDKLTRVMCPKLRHFVVFSSVSCGRGNAGQTNYGMANSVMERICERRVSEGLPGLAVQWGAVGDVGLVAEMQEDHIELVIGGTLQQRISSCLEELDGFLLQRYSTVSSMVVAEKRAGDSGATNVVDAVLNIMGVKDLKTISQNSSLAELGMDSMMAVEIKQALEREFDIFLTAQDIRSLNFSKLRDMAAEQAEADQSSLKTKENGQLITGMKLLVHLLGKEKINPNVRVKLQTKEESGRAEVFLIAGIEGMASVFSNLAPKLRSPATCLQADIRNVERPSIASMADSLLPEVLAKNKQRREFVIVGYSYGSLIALELVRRLEAKGLTCRLVLIDGSPELLKTIKDQQFALNSEAELQNNVLLEILDVLAPAIGQELSEALKKCSSWDEKVEALLSLVPEGATVLSKGEEKEIVTAIYKRLLSLETYNYESLPPLQSPICLVKPTEIMLRSISEDYGLGQMTRGKLEIYHAKGNHINIIDNIKVAAAIDGEPLKNDENL